MKSRTSKNVLISIISGALFLILIVLLRTVDVAPIGPEDTTIGLSHINRAVHDATGVNMALYSFTNVTGGIILAVVAVFGLTGLVQWIRRKNILKVDRELLILGGLYIIVGILYVFFSKVAVNYRPIIMPGEGVVEASFPSSHTMLSCTVMGSTLMLLDKYVRNPTWCKILKAVCVILLTATVVGRLLSGAHWFTDIIGGMLLSICLLSAFAAVLDSSH